MANDPGNKPDDKGPKPEPGDDPDAETDGGTLPPPPEPD